MFSNLTSLKELTFNGKWERCLLYKLTLEFFPHNTSIRHITINSCVVQIEAKSFEPLTRLLFLDLSFNDNLTFQGLSNITDGLQCTNITIFKLNKVHKTFGPCTILTEENLRGFINLKLKEAYFESNRIATLESKSVAYLPLTLETVSWKDNLLMSDHYLTDLVFRCVKGDVRNLIIPDQFISHGMIISFYRD